MDRPDILAVGVALVGFGTIVLGVYQDLAHVGAMYDGTITTGWDGALNHEERLLLQVGLLAVGGTVATMRWRRLAIVPAVLGGVVLYYPLRAVAQLAQRPGLYSEVTTADGATMRFVLGAEPFLLVGGGVLLVAAGVVGWKAHSKTRDDGDVSTAVPSLRS